MVARNLERVADHATNIAEDVIFWMRGADVRHNAAPEEPNSSSRQVASGERQSSPLEAESESDCGRRLSFTLDANLSAASYLDYLILVATHRCS